MNEEIINQYSIITNTGFKIITKDGDDLTDDLKKVTTIMGVNRE